ncbi:type I toxin-antitoxin system toxin [Clostridioides sp. ZZV15-6598]|uniref:type I toxin-antitoxin system toxin n=1 Tax=Clostridioides TaxID=1870884 RepID=UPI001D1099B6|nr:hypothetical protein [Clostridioides sp. ZZV15-6598]
MNEFLLNVIAGVIASWIFCLISKIFAKVKSHSNGRMSGWEFNIEVKFHKKQK